MTRGRWLTPNLGDGTYQCRPLFFPAGADWLEIVNGALLLLCNPNNFEEFGSASAAQTSEEFIKTSDKFAVIGGFCRMVGEVILWAGLSSPSAAWLLCDGSSQLRTDFPNLFDVIGDTYGAEDVDHFSLPDLRGRTVIGTGTGTGLSARVLGDAGGEETHTLETSELPAHSHTDAGHSHSEISASPVVGAAITGVPIPSAVPGVAVTGTGYADISSVGGDGAHNNLQPFLALNYYIVAYVEA